ncbi:MAG: hypothetical protein J6B89_04805 [Bacilli bacterium]|nr:hypothetical protein [Bacilli bacterium]
MKKLPKIYQNQINKKFKNNNTVYYSNQNITNYQNNENQNINTILSTLDTLTQEKGFIFNKPLLIKTKDNLYDTAIVKINSNTILTLNEDTIKIEDILSINRK